MAGEIREAPDVLRRQERVLAGPVAELVQCLRRVPPPFVVTCARGSSAHAATFAKHLIERRFGIPVAAAAPNIATIYRRDLKLEGALLLAVSQSGQSEDLVEQARSAKRGGALTVALVNDIGSPLARASNIVLPLEAGVERSVAATKTFIASLGALLRLCAAWGDDSALLAAHRRLPDRLAAAIALDWRAAAHAFRDVDSLIVAGRGPTLAIAREAALKLKETCNIHAEAFSGAEFRHGPIALVGPDYPILMFVPGDEAAAGMEDLARDVRAKGASVFAASPHGPGNLPMVASDNAETDAVCAIASFYAMAVELTQLRGRNPDRPQNLTKVTSTR